MVHPIQRSPLHELATALREGAARLRLGRGAIAARTGASTRTVSRWLNGQVLPAEYLRDAVLALFAPAGDDIDARLRRALGVPPRPRPPAPPPPAPPPAVDLAALAREVDLALYAAAESMDRSPKKVRAALADFLARVAALQLSAADAHRLVARAAAKKKPA